MRIPTRQAASPLPRGWPSRARSAVLHAISLASTALTVVTSSAVDGRRQRLRQAAEIEALRSDALLLREELRLKDARMARLPPSRRPHYQPLDRMAILELRARHGWSAADTASRFLVEPKTVAAWMRRLDEPGERPLVQTVVPVNRYPDFVGYMVRRLRALCPTMGTRRLVLPTDPTKLRRELALYAHWYDDHRPHQGLGGRTPNEVYFGRAPANERPRHEPRAGRPSDGSCAAPSTEILGRRGAVLRLEVNYLEGRRHLPVVQLRRAA